MKKLALTLAIILGIALGASAQNGGLFGKGPSRDMDYEYGTREGEGPMINLPGSHGSTDDADVPLGGGIALLTGLGAAYLVAKKRKNTQRGAMMALLALLCAFAQGAWAQNWSVWDGHTSTCPSHYSQHWNGTEWVLNTIQIYSADELAYISEHWTDSPNYWVNTDKVFHEISYELYADLDMTAANWTPMGSASYTGALYGNGHTIRYKIDDSSISSNYQGLFKTIGSNGSVNDLHVDCYIKVGNASNVAGICGENEGTIRNCWVSGHIESNHYSAYDADLGGIAGLNDNSGTTEYCCVTADVKNTNGNSGVGGIAGSNEGTIQHVTFYGKVSVEHSQYNKYVGDQDGTLEYYYDTFNQGEYNAASGNDVYCDAILHPYATIINSVGNGVIVANPARTYANQTVTLTVTSGLLETISIKDSDGNNVSYSGNAASGFTFTMQHRDIIVTTQFDTTDWDDENLGTENNPYIIDKNDEWTDFVNHVNNGNSYSGKYVKLTTNISINSMAGSYQSDDNYQPFSGTFDGDGHTLTFNKSDFTDIYAAPFRCVGSASFRNLHVAGTINTTYQYAGGMIAWIVNGNTVSIQNCHSSVTINSSSTTNGGFVSRLGDNATLTISDCIFYGSFEGTGHHNGGFIGYCQGGSSATLVDCLFKPNHISCDLTSCQTFSRGVEATLTRCYYTQTLGTPQGWLAYATEPSVGFYISVTAADGNTYYGVIGVETGNQSYKTYQICEDMEIPSRIIASGNVTLNLGEGTTLHAPKGIDMSNGSSLTINGPGTITIDNCDNIMAGIGLSSTGVLTINSGVVNVTGGAEEGAGIGGNNLGNGSYVIIHGGVVNAVGGWGGAGIGGNKLGNGGNVIIHGGVVNATGGEGGPGIGSGADFRINNQNHPCGDVVITGGQVTAIGNKVYGIGPGAAHVDEYHNGTLQLSWTNTDDFVFISTASAVSYTKRTLSSITFENGKQFYLEHAAAIATESNLYGYKLLPYTGTLPSLAGTGTAGDPFLINNHDDWLLFYWYVNSGTNSYSGQYVKLMTDISVTETVGLRDDKPFSGTFLGNGHTITANISSTTTGTDANEQGVAPFHYIKDATIKDLTVAGSIASASFHTGGLVGFADGTNLIENCIVTATLDISSDYAGGIVGHGLGSTTTIRGCVFAGTINGVDGNRENIGGIWGWSNSGTPTLEDCLEAGTYTNIASMHPMGLQKAAGTITGCYYVNPQVGSPANVCTVSGAAPGNARMIAGYGDSETNGWAFIASPVTENLNPSTVTGLLGTEISSGVYNYDLYRLNPLADKEWENYHQHTDGFVLANSQGYLYAKQSDVTLTFTGAYNLDNTKEVTLQQGFNLVGNPFPRAAYINRSYYTLNSDGSTVSTTPSTEYIPPCHAVVVEATNSESLTFSTKPLAQQSTGNNGGLQIALSQTVATRGGAEAKTIDNAIVTFNEGMELGKFYFGTQDANVYIPQDGKDYAVAYSSGVGKVPVNFKANRNGEYSLTINPEGVEMAYLHLIDNLTGNDVDLLTQPSYTFTARNDDYASRFRLVFSANNENQNENEKDFAFFSNGQFIITSEGTLQIIDMMGRVIVTKQLSTTNSQLPTANFKAGVYVLRLVNGDNIKTQKIVIK